MKLEHLLDKELLLAHAHNHLVGCQRHPTLPLRIYNYTQTAQFENKWGDGTIDYCRGLIVDDDDNIIARPFKKFHNLNTEHIPETMEANLPKTSPTILEKYDGSLGILYRYDSSYGIATRGSFTSPQATWGTKWLRDRVNGTIENHSLSLPTDNDAFTWLFEIIYAENRIVIKYPYEGLVLLGAVAKNNGWEMPYGALQAIGVRNGFMVARQIKDKNIFDCMKDNVPNEEGYVVSYSNGPETSPLKVKIKMEDYVRLHKVITGMNARSVWELLSTGKGTAGFEHTPEHFQRWLASWSKKLNEEFNALYVLATNLYRERPPQWMDQTDRMYRARFAFYVQENVPRELHGVLYAMLDRKNPSEIIWKQIKPRGDDQTFRTEDE